MKKVESAHALTAEEENVRVTRFSLMAQIIHIIIQFYFDLSIEAKQILFDDGDIAIEFLVRQMSHVARYSSALHSTGSGDL